MVDEDSNDCNLGTSTEPLTLGKLIERLDATDVGYADMGVTTTIPECFLASNLTPGSTPEGLRGVGTVHSPFYDDLEPYHDERAEAFLDRWKAEHREDE